MSLIQGSRVGRYEIQSLIGAGGMGEVYRALDEKLGREVAIKILPTAFAADTERLARFEREARTLAALNHPNIAAIYEIAESNGVPALILELIDGETLEDRLAPGFGRRASGSVARRNSASGPEPGTQSLTPEHANGLAIAEALHIALPIAEALEAAHERGVVHRDLKPANVKLTYSGTVKLLDFGLAKAPSETARDSVSQSPTKALHRTDPGAILGTVTYMSPEQSRGLPVTRQADVWAFGCVLYEMLTGRAVFAGETVPDILVNILERTPDWSLLPPDTPPNIRVLLRRCLEKETRRRLRDIGDAKLEIEEALSHRSDPQPSARRVSAAVVHFSRLTDFVGHKESPAISPDGKMVAFVGMVDGRRQIWVRMMAGGAALQVTRDRADHEQPRWAPDSSTLLYFTQPANGAGDGAIWQISALGGQPRKIATSMGGGDMSRDGRQIAVFQGGTDAIELVSVSRDGSRRSVVARLPSDHLYRAPRWSPDGRAIAFQVGSINAIELGLDVIDLETGERRQLARRAGSHGFTWRHDGSGLVYSSSIGSTLLYPPIFNLRTVDRNGQNDRELTFGDTSFLEPDIHASGAIVATRARSRSDIWRFPVTGTPAENTAAAVRVTHQSGHVQTPSVSPDESEVVFVSDNGGHGNLWVAGTDGASARQITFDTEPEVSIGMPTWSPTGEWIAFLVANPPTTGLFLIRPDGSDRRPIGPVRGWHASWSPDGQWLYYSTPNEAGLRLEKARVDDGQIAVVYDNVTGRANPPGDGSTLAFARTGDSRLLGRWSGESEVVAIQPDGATRSLARLRGARIPISPLLFQPFMAPDGESIAFTLIDGATTNIWALGTAGRPLQPLTDFGNRAILIARSVSWSSDSRSIYAAVGEVEADIVLFDGLLD